MGYAELIERLRSLPKEKQAEIFDFVEYLSARFGNPEAREALAHDWSDEDFAQLAMRQALRGIEGDPAAYQPEDLQERWQ